MKHISLNKCVATLLALALLFSFAPLALADNFYYAPVIGKYTIYHSMDKVKSFYDVDVGSFVQVYGTQTWSTGTWLRVAATTDDGSKQVGYVSTSAIPAGIPATSFIGTATATASTHLFCSYSTNSATMTSIPVGTEVKVLNNYGDWMLVLTNNVFYGYVQSSMFSTLTTTAPVLTGTPTTPLANTSNTNGVTTSVNLLSQTVVSKGSLAKGTKLYKTNKMEDAYAFGQVTNGGTCDVYYAVDNQFVLVATGNIYAYVPSQCLTIYNTANGMPQYAGEVATINVVNPNATPSTVAPAAASDTATIGNCSKWVSMRAKAKSSSSRVAKVPAGSTVTVLGTSGTYTKCKYDGKTGYILSTYVK